jgi:Flagellar-associated PapD-like
MDSDSSSDDDDGGGKVAAVVSKRTSDSDSAFPGSRLASKGRFLSESRGDDDALLMKQFTAVAGPTDGLRVEPERIRFESVEPGVLYVMTFSLRNMSKKAHRIRIESPKSEFFALNYIPSGSVAPGLDVRGEIECQLPVNSADMYFTDHISASMGPYKVKIPIFACKPHADIQFEPLVNFGSVGLGSFSTADVYFVNHGTIPGSITFAISPANQSRIKMSAMKFDLLPGAKERIVVTMDGKDLGLCRELVGVSIRGGLEDSLLDVTGQIVDQKLSIISGKTRGIMDVAELGSTFYGQPRTIVALITNTGPQPLSFNISYPDDDDAKLTASIDSLPTDPQVEETIPLEKYLSISPSEGVVQPYSDVLLTLSFSPLLQAPKNGFQKEFLVDSTEPKAVARRACFEVSETGQKSYVLLQGCAMMPSIKASPMMLRFGDCAVHDRRDILISFTNSSMLETSYRFSSQAFFKVDPAAGFIEPNQTKTAIVSFCPNQLGNFKTSIRMVIADGLQTITFKVTATSDDVGERRVLVGGADKLPNDFKVTHKFVDPEEVAARRRDKLMSLTLGAATKSARFVSPSLATHVDALISSSMSKDRDEIYGPYGSSASSDGVVNAVTESLMRKRENDRTYNDFLQQSYAKRTTDRQKIAQERILSRGGPDRTNPYGIDMGMDRGLDEPSLPIPVGGEGLWTMSKAKGDGSGSKAKKSIDENRLIQKKFSSQPSTPAEMKDCSCEIGQEDQKLIHGSHKVYSASLESLYSSKFESYHRSC